ncbi:Ig-like domain-containing protein [Streptomyces sp. NPDC092296]|uniref:L,D-transpeptidase n=1 Tax=Streptomyces sp. NPDC092296 TaxID=3366012 RepID=UPI003813A425
MTAPEKQPPATTRDWTRRSLLAGLAAAPAALLAACSSPDHPAPPRAGQTPGAGPGGSAAASPRVSTARVTVSPADGTRDADFERGVTITATGGRLTSVKVTDDSGRPVPGTMSADSTRWQSTGRLGISARYAVTAGAVDPGGLPAEAAATFTTKAADHTFVGFFTPEDGSTSGVGMPVSINFNAPVRDRKAVQQAITVTADPDVEIVGHWYDDTRLDFRPEQYWAPGTRITLRLRLKDVEGAPGVYGIQSKDVHFTIGRSQISVVDLGSKRMTVRRDGRVTATYEVSGGSPEHTTWAGRMVISEQHLKTRMNSRTVGLGGEYDIPDVPHAQRLTTSGTFIHGNYWAAPSVFGHQNTSHGCIGLRDVKGAKDPHTPAAEFYAGSMLGDVVEVVHSGDRVVSPGNGLSGWNVPWADWKAGSAL